MLNFAKEEGLLKGIDLGIDCVITHLIFVDDVLLAGMATVAEWGVFRNILNCFCRIYGMKISLSKSSFYYHSVDSDDRTGDASIFPYNFHPLDDGLKYLGFFLRPNNYQIKDWWWLVRKFEARISHWAYRLLSVGGRLTLVKAVLMGIPVYWLSLLEVPIYILNFIGRMIFNFLWSGGIDRASLEMTSWESVSRPEIYGGWGIKDLKSFSLALRAKRLWRCPFNHNPWSKISFVKYINMNLVEWIRLNMPTSPGCSPLWRGMLKVSGWIIGDLRWQVGNRKAIRVGNDHILGIIDPVCLSNKILDYIKIYGLSFLDRIRNLYG
jgi:hypothetical protein